MEPTLLSVALWGAVVTLFFVDMGGPALWTGAQSLHPTWTTGVLCPHTLQDWFWGGGVWTARRAARRSLQVVAGAAGAQAVGAELASGGDGGRPLSTERGAGWGAALGHSQGAWKHGPCVTSLGLEGDAEDGSLLWAEVDATGECREWEQRDGQGRHLAALATALGWSTASLSSRHLSARSVFGVGSWGPVALQRRSLQPRAVVPTPLCVWGEPSTLAVAHGPLSPRGQCAASGPAGVLGGWTQAWVCTPSPPHGPARNTDPA